MLHVKGMLKTIIYSVNTFLCCIHNNKKIQEFNWNASTLNDYWRHKNSSITFHVTLIGIGPKFYTQIRRSFKLAAINMNPILYVTNNTRTIFISDNRFDIKVSSSSISWDYTTYKNGREEKKTFYKSFRWMEILLWSYKH